MTFRDHGYYAYAWLGARITQAVVLLPIIGMVGNFLGTIAKSKHSPPSELVATIVFTVLSFLWTILSVTAYHDSHIPYLLTLVVEIVFLIPFAVFAVILGQPLSITTCSDLPSNANHVALPISSVAGQPVSYLVFSGAGQTTCYELMAIWGLMIALCVLFTITAVTALFLLLGKRRGGGGPGKGSMPGSPRMGSYAGSMPGSPMSGPPMSPRGSFDGPPSPGGPPGGFGGLPPPRGPPGGFGGPMSPMPPPRGLPRGPPRH